MSTQMTEHAHRYTAELAQSIEERWQTWWAHNRTFCQPNPGEPDFDPAKPKYYVLDMFPYPSGAGLHVGHPVGYIATDIVARFKRMTGHNVLHPMGWDAFGLPAEQYAIQTGVHPEQTTRTAIDTFRGQLQRFGLSYDWEREFGTIDPDYYKWTQWIFLQLYNAWFDTERNKARPIADLIEELGRGAIRVSPAGELVRTGAEHALEALEGPGPSLAWADLAADQQRRLIDEHRLAYIGEQVVNWCPKLGTALANEEVIDGRSERGGFPVFRKPLRQWMLRITAYAERLLEGLKHVDWPDSTKTQQAEWIGRSEGAEVVFALDLPDDAEGGLGFERLLEVFTTRPDTLFGATYMVVAPEHALIEQVLASPRPQTDVDALRDYAHQARNRSDVERQESKDKTGVFTGLYAINPVNNKRIPIWTSDYVLATYGTGAIMAVPAHDQRDFEFAKAFNIDIVQVVEPADGNTWDPSNAQEALAAYGTSVNSTSDTVSITGLPTDQAKAAMIDHLEQAALGRRRINYKLRDWLFSRQRYWGEPFPIVFDSEGNHHAVDPSALPVELPALADFAPEESDDPQPMLAKAADWLLTTAGDAGVSALPAHTPVTREANTMPNWAGSCWYYLRYADPENGHTLIGNDAERYWMGTGKAGGVDLYIGGAEHAVLHLLYARFWHMVLYDLGHVSTPEPFARLFHQGLIQSYAYQRPDTSLVPIDEVEQRDDSQFVESATGAPVKQVVAKMSKSLRNVIGPDEIVAEFGVDALRLYEMYMTPLESAKPWNTKDLVGLYRFLQRVWRLIVDEHTGELACPDQADDSIETQLHRTIAKVQADVEGLRFNTAIAAMIELVNAASKAGGMTPDQLSRFARILSPFAPHIAEEMWSRLGHDPPCALAAWPAHDEARLTDDTVEIAVQIMGKVKARLSVPADADAKQLESLALADPEVARLIKGKTVRKVVAVPGKLVNIVAN